MIRVLVADDHPIVRRGLRQILADTRDLVAAGEAVDGTQVLRLVQHERWDVVVLDLNMPGRSGLELIRELKTEKPLLPVLVLSMYPEDQFAERVLKAGASGYMTKDSAPEELVGAIRKVCAGGTYVSPGFAEKLASGLKVQNWKPRHEALSNREFQVLRSIVAGRSLTMIADELGLSVKTISTHRSHILQKLEMKSNAELIRYALENHLVD